ncbi:MAG: DUF7282 domain-containing protein [Candidatus Nanopelagicales bacterium]
MRSPGARLTCLALVAMTGAGLAGCAERDSAPVASAIVLTGRMSPSASSEPADAAGGSAQRPSPAGDQAGAGWQASDLDEGSVVVELAESAEHTVVDEEADLEVDSQIGDGTRVAIAEAWLSRGPGFVAIFDDELRLLATSRVGAGSEPVSIALSNPVPTDRQLLAVLYLDDGDKRADLLRDALVLDDDGEVEAEDFVYRLSR